MVFTNNSVTLALLSFFSTTVDDFCVILIFFAREYVKTHSVSNKDTVLSFIKISIGQFIGFSIIVAVSLVLGVGLHSVVNNDYIDLIGLLPILIGLYKVYEIIEEAGYFTQLYKIICCIKYSPIVGDTEEQTDDEESNLGSVINPAHRGQGQNQGQGQGHRKDDVNGEEMKESIELTSTSTFRTKGENEIIREKNSEDKTETSTKDSMESDSDRETEVDDMKIILNDESLETLDSVDKTSGCVFLIQKMFYCLDPLIFEVAIYALMFGTDNIAIYVALFSNVTLFETAAVCTFFYLMLLLYLVIAIFIIVQVNTHVHIT